MQILGVLWNRGPSTAREVLETLPDKKPRAYTSVLSILQGMDRKGLVKRQREGLTDRWRAAQKRETILHPFFGNLVKKVFAGRPSAAFQHLMRSGPINDEELAEIERMIREHRNKRKS